MITEFNSNEAANISVHSCITGINHGRMASMFLNYNSQCDVTTSKSFDFCLPWWAVDFNLLWEATKKKTVSGIEFVLYKATTEQMQNNTVLQEIFTRWTAGAFKKEITEAKWDIELVRKCCNPVELNDVIARCRESKYFKLFTPTETVVIPTVTDVLDASATDAVKTKVIAVTQERLHTIYADRLLTTLANNSAVGRLLWRMQEYKIIPGKGVEKFLRTNKESGFRIGPEGLLHCITSEAMKFEPINA